MIPGWVPRWHPFVWLAVAIMIYLIWTNPAVWGRHAAGILHLFPEAANRVGIFFQNI